MSSRTIRNRNAPSVMTRVRQMVDSKLTMNLEMKRLGISCSGGMTITGTMFPLTQGIIEGDASFERSGEQITLKEVDIKVKANVHGSSATRTDYLRYILFMDTANNGNTPSVAHLINTTDTTASYADDIWKTKRMRVISDRTIPCGTVNGSIGTQKNHTIKLDTKCFFQGSTNATASNGKNSLWLYAWSSNSTFSPGLVADVLVKFVDA